VLREYWACPNSPENFTQPKPNGAIPIFSLFLLFCPVRADELIWSGVRQTVASFYTRRRRFLLRGGDVRCVLCWVYRLQGRGSSHPAKSSLYIFYRERERERKKKEYRKMRIWPRRDGIIITGSKHLFFFSFFFFFFFFFFFPIFISLPQTFWTFSDCRPSPLFWKKKTSRAIRHKIRKKKKSGKVSSSSFFLSRSRTSSLRSLIYILMTWY
jgi:hypothetical protein